MHSSEYKSSRRPRDHHRTLVFENLENRVLLANNSGPALLLAGADATAIVADNASLDLGTGANDGFTIEINFYLSSSPLRRTITLAEKPGTYFVGLITNDFSGLDNIFFEIGQPDGSRFISAASALSTGWHHIAAVFDNEVTSDTDYLAFYVDGVRRTSNSSDFLSVPNTTSDFRIGHPLDTLSNGYVDEVRLSDIARYSGESYIVETAPFSSDDNTRALWHFDEAVGSTTFVDASPNGNTLTGLDGAQTANAPSPNQPIITSDGGGNSAARNVAENSTDVTTVTATDADAGTTLTYSISGGADAANFMINSSSGVLIFASAPNFEAPTDAGANNIYNVTVQVSDGALIDTQAIAVTVTNVNEAPVISSDGGGEIAMRDVEENSTAVTTVSAVDADASTTLTYSISGGADAAKFTIDSASGELTFVSAPDYEAAGDAGANNIYDVTVQVSDGILTDTQEIVVTLMDVDESPTLPGDYNRNGEVNAADFIVWRKMLGQTGIQPFSGADGDGDGDVTQADHTVWRTNFGATTPAPSFGSATSLGAAPAEPAAPDAAAAGERGAGAQPVTGTSQTPAPQATSLVQFGASQSSRSRVSTRELPLVAERHDVALLAWLAAVRKGPRLESASAAALEFVGERAGREPAAVLGTMLDLAFASMNS
jgi:hypothetical protein